MLSEIKFIVVFMLCENDTKCKSMNIKFRMQWSPDRMYLRHRQFATFNILTDPNAVFMVLSIPSNNEATHPIG